MAKRGFRTAQILTVGVLALTVSTKAYAQPVAEAASNAEDGESQRPSQPDASPAAAVQPPSAQNAGDIIVTATRRATRLQDVPVSVLVINPDRLQQTGLLSTADLPNLAPSLYFAPANSSRTTQFIVRGVGTFAVTNALETSVGVAVDGVPIARSAGQIADLVDIDHIEILRGPQGTLFGKNATAGVVSITTRLPRIGETSLVGNVSFGSFSEINVDVAQNIALGDNAALRLTAWRYAHDGYLDSAVEQARFGDRNTYGIRAGLRLNLTERLTYTIVGQYDGRDQRGIVATAFRFTGRTPPVISNRAAQLGVVAGPDNRVADTGTRPYSRADNYSLTGIGEYDLGGGYTLSSLTSYREVNSDSAFDAIGFSQPGFGLINLNEDGYRTVSQEVRISSPAERPLSFVAGLFYYHFRSQDNTLQFGVAPPSIGNVAITNPTTVVQDNYAAFADVTWRVVPGVRLIGGIRQSRDEVSGRFTRANLAPPTPPFLSSFAPLSFVAPDLEYDFTSYRVGAQVDLRRDLMLYATVSRGYKGPGYNFTPSLTATQVNNVGSVVDAETVQSYEAGLRGQFFDRRLSVNIAAFYSTFENFQATVASSLNPPIYTAQNADELVSQGVEFDITANLIDGLSFGVAGAYTDARFTDFSNAPCFGGQPTRPAGSPLTPGFCVGGVQDLEGVRLPQAPEWVLNGNFRYQHEFAGDWRLFLTGDVTYRSQVNFEANSDPVNVQEGYTLVNGTIGFGPQDERWTLSFYARNLFDQSFVSRRREFNGYYQQYIPYEAARRIGVTLAFRY